MRPGGALVVEHGDPAADAPQRLPGDRPRQRLLLGRRERWWQARRKLLTPGAPDIRTAACAAPMQDRGRQKREFCAARAPQPSIPGPRGIVRRPTQADRRQQILTLRDSWRDRGARAGAESRYCLAPGYRTYLLCGCCSYWPAVPAAVSPYVRAHMTAAGQTISLLTIGSNDPPPNQ